MSLVLRGMPNVLRMSCNARLGIRADGPRFASSKRRLGAAGAQKPGWRATASRDMGQRA
jgi:hypothetical protein